MHQRMDWNSVSFDWNQVRAFLATVETGSFSAAARALGLAQPTLGRQVAGLEADLGVTLFERLGKSLILTEAGQELLGAVREMGAAAGRISLTAAGQSQAIEGLVRISVGDALATCLLPPILARLGDIAPGVVIELIVSNELSDLRRREADIAVRHVRPTEPELIARFIRDSRARLYAAPSYLARHGRPTSGAELKGALVIGFERGERMLEILRAHGLAVEQENFRHYTNNTVVGWEMVRQGLGIGIMMEEVAAATKGVELVLPGFTPIPVPIWLTTHRELRTSRRIRLVYDFLAEELGRINT